MRKIFHFGAIPLAAIASGVLIGATPSQAAMTTYNTRGAFSAAAGKSTVQTFNQIVADTPYSAAPLNVADQFTVGGTGLGAFPGDNIIDVPPLSFAGADVDGTPQIAVLTDEFINLVITFTQPVRAFGADFAGFNNPSEQAPFRTGIEIGGTTFLPALDGVTQFWGVVSDTPFTTVSFISYDVDRFAIDNVVFATAETGAVPEPATWAIMIAGFGLAGATLRRRPRLATTPA